MSINPLHPKRGYTKDELQYYLSEFGNFLRDNYHGMGTPRLIAYDTTKHQHGTVDEILETWMKTNIKKP